MQRVNKKSILLQSLAGLLALCLLTGCATRGKIDLLESQLRVQESQVRLLESDLQSARIDLDVAQKEASTLRSQLASNNTYPIVSEDAQVLYRTKGLQINKLLTGGLNQDDQAGDDLLNAVIVPVDAQGELVKVPGKIEIELFDLSQPKEKQRIGQWEFSEADSQKNWHHGFFSSGYQFRLPWQTIPQNSQLTIHARLTTSEGRQFDISEKLTITPPPSPQNQFVEQATPLEPVKQPHVLQQLPSRSVENNSSEINPFKKISQENKIESPNTGTTPLGESPWRVHKPNAQTNPALKTSDRRSNPVYDAQRGRVLR